MCMTKTIIIQGMMTFSYCSHFRNMSIINEKHKTVIEYFIYITILIMITHITYINTVCQLVYKSFLTWHYFSKNFESSPINFVAVFTGYMILVPYTKYIVIAGVIALINMIISANISIKNCKNMHELKIMR